MLIAGKEINDECKYCGEVLQCELFRQGHGIKCKRKNIVSLIKCQMEHKEARNK